jgi:4'-phosphopantetheinyl transferase
LYIYEAMNTDLPKATEAHDGAPIAEEPCPGVDVDLWVWSLDASQAERAIYESYLSHDEIERADRFRFERLRNDFVASQGKLRETLALYLGQHPSSIRFVRNAFGKPAIAADDLRIPFFNLSHSGGLAALAVCCAIDVGVDIEAVRQTPVADIPASFFTEGETQDLLGMDEADRHAGFFRCWTRKEAFIKAVGQGLSLPLNSFDVECRLHQEARLRWVAGCPDAAEQWSIRAFEPKTGWIGAVAAKTGKLRLSLRTGAI